METKNELFVSHLFWERFTKSFQIILNKGMILTAVVYILVMMFLQFLAHQLSVLNFNQLVVIFLFFIASTIFGFILQVSLILQLKNIEYNTENPLSFNVIYQKSIDLFFTLLLTWRYLFVPVIILIVGYVVSFGTVISMYLGIDLSSIQSYFGFSIILIIIGFIILIPRLYSLIFIPQLVIRNDISGNGAIQESRRITEGRKSGIFSSIFGFSLVLCILLIIVTIIFGLLLPTDNIISEAISGGIVFCVLLLTSTSYLYLLFLDIESRAAKSDPESTN